MARGPRGGTSGSRVLADAVTLTWGFGLERAKVSERAKGIEPS